MRWNFRSAHRRAAKSKGRAGLPTEQMVSRAATTDALLKTLEEEPPTTMGAQRGSEGCTCCCPPSATATRRAPGLLAEADNLASVAGQGLARMPGGDGARAASGRRDALALAKSGHNPQAWSACRRRWRGAM